MGVQPCSECTDWFRQEGPQQVNEQNPWCPIFADGVCARFPDAPPRPVLPKRDPTLTIEVRRWLWDLCPHEGKYGDDGEMQCRTRDFMRDQPYQLMRHLKLAWMEQAGGDGS